MTNEEKAAQTKQRDDAIVAYYQEGHKISQCARHFHLNRQRVLQILKHREAWVPYVRGPKSDRTDFLGINITEADKQALKAEADKRGVSMSALSAEVISGMLNKETA